MLTPECATPITTTPLGFRNRSGAVSLHDGVLAFPLPEFNPGNLLLGGPLPQARLERVRELAKHRGRRDLLPTRPGGTAMADFVKVAETNEIEPSQARLVNVQGKRIAVFNVDGEFFAIDNTCTHRGGPLAEGAIAGHAVTCPWHGATYDIRTGEVLGPPAPRGVARYSVRVTGTDIEVEV